MKRTYSKYKTPQYKKKTHKRKENTIKVYGTDMRLLSKCSRKRAKRLVDQKRGYMLDKNSVVLCKSLIEDITDKRDEKIISDNICYICNEVIEETSTIDHIIPKYNDVATTISFNMKCCCYRCNHDKDNMTLSEYVDHIKQNRDKYDYISDERLLYLEHYAYIYEREFYKYFFNKNRMESIRYAY